MIKQEESIENAENYQAGDEGVPNPASRALIEFSNQSKLTGASIGSLKMGSLKMLLQNSEGGPQGIYWCKVEKYSLWCLRCHLTLV